MSEIQGQPLDLSIKSKTVISDNNNENQKSMNQSLNLPNPLDPSWQLFLRLRALQSLAARLQPSETSLFEPVKTSAVSLVSSETATTQAASLHNSPVAIPFALHPTLLSPTTTSNISALHSPSTLPLDQLQQYLLNRAIQIQTDSAYSSPGSKLSTPRSPPTTAATISKTTATTTLQQRANTTTKTPEEKRIAPSEFKRCGNCDTRVTSMWRRDEGRMLCNACKLYKNLHGSDRPMSFRKDRVYKRMSRPKLAAPDMFKDDAPPPVAYNEQIILPKFFGL